MMSQPQTLHHCSRRLPMIDSSQCSVSERAAAEELSGSVDRLSPAQLKSSAQSIIRQYSRLSTPLSSTDEDKTNIVL